MSTIPCTMVNEVIGVQKSDNSNLYVGLCGTMFVGSDRYAVVITEVISPKVIRVDYIMDLDYDSKNHIIKDEDDNEFIPECFMSKYSRVNKNKTGFVGCGSIFKLRKNGRWIREGCGLWETGGVHFGRAENYRDPSF